MSPEPQPGANRTSTEDAADLRRAFSLALADALKEPKVSSSTLEVVRKFLADCESDRRWAAEQALMPPAPQGTDSATPAGPGSTSLPPAVAAALPFAASIKTTNAAPSGTDEATRSFASVSPRLSDEALPFLAS
jgi:hypothetical protein